MKRQRLRSAIGYVRVSTSDQAEDGVSLHVQRERIAAYAAAHGLGLAEVFADEGLSAKRGSKRPGLEKAMREVCKTRGLLIVFSLSRFARSTHDAIVLVERLEKCQADLASITESIDTTSAMGRFVFRLFASLGELERDQVSERTRAAMQHQRQRGRRISGRVPYGYDLRDDGQLVRNRREQRHLQKIVRWRMEGLSMRAIAERLNAKGIPAKQGGQWVVSGVQSVLRRASRDATG